MKFSCYPHDDDMMNFKCDLVTQKGGNGIPAESSAYDKPKLNDHLESIRLETVTFSRTGLSLDLTAEVRARTYGVSTTQLRVQISLKIVKYVICAGPVIYKLKWQA